jgi:Transcription factor WhiB
MTHPVIFNEDNRWRDEAACARDDPRHWTGKGGDKHYARTVCMEICTVRDECLTTALTNGDVEVIAGGVYLRASYEGSNGDKMRPIGGKPCDKCGFEVVYVDDSKPVPDRLLCEACKRMKECPGCGVEFYQRPKSRRIYCSVLCRNRRRIKRRIKTQGASDDS